MNTTRIAVTAVALLLSAAPAWAIYKCAGPDGKPVYQDMPCAGQGGEVVIKPASGNGDPATIVSAQTQLDKTRHDNAIFHGIATGQPINGMNAEQLQKALGAPNKVNTANYGGKHEDQWIFYKPGGTWYVYTTNGIVTSTQFSEGSGPGTQAARRQQQRRGKCPSEMKLRSLRVSANKLDATVEAKAAYQRALDDARENCD